MFLLILHVVSSKEAFLLFDDVDSQQPESSLLLCESETGPLQSALWAENGAQAQPTVRGRAE